MLVQATVTNVFTNGYVEVAPWENGAPGERREVAETAYKKPRRNDVVEMVPAKPQNTPVARIAYIAPVFFFAFGVYITGSYDLFQRLLTGAIMFGMTFVMAWLMNRSARLRRRLSWSVSRVIRRAESF